MQLPNLRQPCNHSTLMGVMRGAADCFGLSLSTPMLYGLSGHAFLANIHRDLCPSGPYCWNREPCWRLLRNAGLAVEDLGFWWNEGGADSREVLEARLRDALDTGFPCFLVNMEYQLITGYDETGFLTAQPWAPKVDFPPKHLTFGTWSELGNEIHINFHILRPVEPADRREAVWASLAYAEDLWANPATHAADPYAVGAGAYAHWLAALEAGAGTSHGHWWNATVYAECRSHAAAWLDEVAGALDAPAAAALAPRYARIGECLGAASDRAMDLAEQRRLIAEAAEIEAACTAALPGLAAALRE